MRQQTTTSKIPKMSYGDFFIRFGHKFLGNIYSDEEVKQSRQIFTLEKYYETYQKILSIFGSNMNQEEEQFDQDLKYFL